MTTATVEGKLVKIGDYVGFKSGIEQSGKIVAIKQDRYRGAILVIENVNGFDGDYIGGETQTEVDARDCWIG